MKPRVIIYIPPRIQQPISWHTVTHRFLWWEWVSYEVLMTNGKYLPCSRRDIEANAYD